MSSADSTPTWESRAAGPPVAERIRNPTWTEPCERKTIGIGPARIGDGLLNLGREADTVLTYEDLLAHAREVAANRYGIYGNHPDPGQLRRRLLEIVQGDHTAANLALFELGNLVQYAPPAS